MSHAPHAADIRPESPRSRRRLVTWIAATTAVVGLGLVLLVLFADSLVAHYLRPATIAYLESRFAGRVELDGLYVRVFPQLSVRGEGLTVRFRGRTDLPPLVAIQEFSIAATPRQLWNSDIQRVHLRGFELTIPPGRTDTVRTLAKPSPDEEQEPAGTQPEDRREAPVVIREIVTENGLLTIMSKKEGKAPRVFQLKTIRMEDLDFERPSPFQATLVNPTPTGDVAVVGTFGPWHKESPSETPVGGTFTFVADLGSIRGLGGALDAEGSFGGPLEYIRTSGKARVPDFSLSSGGAEFPLNVTYDAIVDGTNGDTTLERVEGTLGRSEVSARGEIAKVDDERPGRQLHLETATRNGRLEDFLRLTTRITESPMSGLVDSTATLLIPPGPEEVIERLRLDGQFSVASVHFANESVQNRIDELSRRGQGRPKDQSIDNVGSDLRGRFRMADRRLTINGMSFKVRGAEVRLGGFYDTQSERIDFEGVLRLQARASKTQTGWRSLVLKVFDPLLDAPGAGTELPIYVKGTKTAPKFGADLKQALFK